MRSASTTPRARRAPADVRPIATDRLLPNPLSLALYGDPGADTDTAGLIDSIRREGILEPLLVAPAEDAFSAWQVLSGHRRLACARALGLDEVPCLIRDLPPGPDRDRLVIDANRHRLKTFSQRMREADALEALQARAAQARRLANLRPSNHPERRDPDAPAGRTDETIAQAIALGGKDRYRQARAVWKAAQADDPRARCAVAQLDDGTKTIHAAYKDLRRRDRFSAGFKPTPYDVWSFRHDPAYGVPHPGSIPPAIIAHTLHYFTAPGDLVVDPMAGGGTTLDVCAAMGRRCLAYDLAPVRPDVRPHDVRDGLPPETAGCQLIFADPPYHTMLARRYPEPGLAESHFLNWIAFLQEFSRIAFLQLRPGGHIALLLANQTERDLPRAHGYIDHAFLGYQALLTAGFVPVRRISCPMAGGHLPQQVRRARDEGRMLGLVRDLLVMRKPPADDDDQLAPSIGSPPASS